MLAAMTARLLLPALLGTALAAGCGADPQPAADDAAHAPARVEVVATTTQLGDFVREVGGDAVDVHQILQPNTDPHEYDPRPADVERTAGAKLVVESGNALDRWMADVVGQAGGHPAVLAIAPRHTPFTVPGEASGREASTFDPHWWHDPRDAEAAVLAIRDALVKAAPAAADAFRRDAASYEAKLHTLDSGIAACFAKVPPAARKLVTSHDAFGYFARRYGITVVGAVIPSQSTQAQPSAGQISKLAGLVKAEHVRAIYPESSISPKLADAIAHQTGARSDLTLYGDTLGPAGSPGDTYLHMEQANADAMVDGFTGGAQRCTIPGI
jgi:zinc/manganese transport system substrate-binding protein